MLVERGLYTDKEKERERIFYETGMRSNFFEVGKMFLGEEIKEVIRTKLDI